MNITMGARFGKLLVLDDCGTIAGHPAYLCRCDCGAFKRLKRSKVLRDKSCGNCTGKRRATPALT